MASTSRADAFSSALQEFERSGDDSDLRQQFAEDAELMRPPAAGAGDPTSDVGQFWDGYRSQFSEISTEFTHVDESDHLAILEWVSRGKLSTGRPIEYRGVSLLTYDGDDRVRRFSTYFDTAAFLQPENGSS